MTVLAPPAADPEPSRFRGHVRRDGRWLWTVYDTDTGDAVADGSSASQRTAFIAADSWIRLRHP